MPFNVLLLPLLGGYIVTIRWNRTRFESPRHSGYRLLFHAAIAGVCLLVLAYPIIQVTSVCAPGVVERWDELVPFDYMGTGLLAFLLGVLAPWPLNKLAPREGEARRVIAEWGDFLEVLLDDAMRETLQVAVTTKSRKFYIGFVTSNFDPAYERKYIKLMPMQSGYRDASTLRFQVTTEYWRVYESISDPFVDAHADYFQIVIPVSEIADAKIFDPEVYQEFQNLAPDSEVETGEEEPETEEA